MLELGLKLNAILSLKLPLLGRQRFFGSNAIHKWILYPVPLFVAKCRLDSFFAKCVDENIHEDDEALLVSYFFKCAPHLALDDISSAAKYKMLTRSIEVQECV